MKKSEEAEIYKSQTICKSCGKFIGTYERCPYCLANNKKRLSVRLLKLYAVFATIAGLVLTLYIAKHIKPPQIKIKQITPFHNFAYVSIKGIAARDFKYNEKWGSLYGALSQKEREKNYFIRISAYQQVAKILSQKGLPKKGDEILVTGQIRYQAKKITLMISRKNGLLILNRNKKRKVSAKYLLGQKAKIKGEITDKTVYKTGTFIELNASLNVWIPAKIIPPQEAEVFEKGRKFQFIGKITKYKGAYQLEVTDRKNISLISETN